MYTDQYSRSSSNQPNKLTTIIIIITSLTFISSIYSLGNRAVSVLLDFFTTRAKMFPTTCSRRDGVTGAIHLTYAVIRCAVYNLKRISKTTASLLNLPIAFEH